jgi:TRAP-type mannitol/chloroaromatic compound transport system permease small subunit
MKALERILHIIDALSKYSGLAFGYLVLVLTAVVMVGVAGRYIFHAGVDYCFELAIVVFMPLFIMGGAYTLLYSGHVRMDLIYSHLSKRKRALLDVVLSTAFFFFVGLLTYKSGDHAVTSTLRLETTKDYMIPLWPSIWALPVAGALLLLQGAAKLVRDLFYLIAGRELT